MRGPKPQTLILTEEHVEILRRNLRTGKTEHRVARRAQVLLLRADGVGPGKVATQLAMGRNTVWRIENRYRSAGLAALQDLPRPGRPRTISPPADRTDGRSRLSPAC